MLGGALFVVRIAGAAHVRREHHDERVQRGGDRHRHMDEVVVERACEALAGEGGCAEQQHGGGEHEVGRELARVRDGA